MHDRQPMKTLSYRSYMWLLGGTSYNSSKAVLNTPEPAMINSRETSKQGITVVKLTCNQGGCCQKSSFRCKIPSESLLIPGMNKTSLTYISDLAREGKIRIKPDTKVPNRLSRWKEVTKYINWEKFAKFVWTVFKPNKINPYLDLA